MGKNGQRAGGGGGGEGGGGLGKCLSRQGLVYFKFRK